MDKDDPLLHFGKHFVDNEGIRKHHLIRNNYIPDLSKIISETLLNVRLATSINEVFPEYLQIPDGVIDISDLIQKARTVVTTNWKKYVAPLVVEYVKNLQSSQPELAGQDKITEIFSDAEKFDYLLREHRLCALEALRSIDSSLWQRLALLSSARQRAVSVLLWKWITDERHGLSDDCISGMETTRSELLTLVELSSFTGRQLDNAFIKQTELADLPGGSVATPFGDNIGASRLYDVSKDGSDHFTTYTFADVFPAELEKFAHRLSILAKRIEKRLSALPSTYTDLPEYLRAISATYLSDEKNPKEIEKLWRDLDDRAAKLAKNGCPIIIIPQACPSVAGDANKVDIEIRFGMRTKGNIKREYQIQPYVNIAQALNYNHRDALSEQDYKVPPIHFNELVFGHGSSLIWMTPAEQRPRMIVVSENTTKGEAQAIIPIVTNVLSKTIDNQQFVNDFVNDTALHELGHAVLPSDDEAITKRIGTSSEAAILEELKADAVSMLLFYKKNHEAPDWKNVAQRQLTSTFGAICDYLINMSNEEDGFGKRYYYSGIAHVKRLIECGALTYMDNHYTIANGIAGIRILAELGQSIIDLYADLETTPQKVVEFVRSIREEENENEVQQFLRELKLNIFRT